MTTLLNLNFTGSASTNVATLVPQPLGASLATVTGLIRTSGSRAYRAADPTGECQSNQHFGTADYTVSAVFRQLTVETANAFRLIGRRVDGSNYYFLEYNSGTGDIILYKRVAASNTALGSAYAWSPSTVTDYTLALVMNGNSISVTLDGVTIIGPVTDTGVDPADTTYQSVAIYLTSSAANNASNGWHIDNLKVETFTGGSLVYTEADVQTDTRELSAASQILTVLLLNTDGTPATGKVFSDITCSLAVDGSAPSAQTLVTMTLGTYTSLGFKEQGALAPGRYAFCPATLPSSGKKAIYTFTGTGLRQAQLVVDLVATDPRAARPSKEEIADETNRRGIGVIKTVKRTGTNGNGGLAFTGPDGADTTVLATDPDAEQITEFDTAS